jgi:two-component system LytT family response regulator
MNAVIVDDEKNGRDLLSSMLKTHCEDVMVVATAASALEGIKVIQKHSPDLVFLDVQMPHGTGFDLLEAFPKRNFEVIFTTAHQEYAIKAIKEDARDYLVKPIDPDDLESVLERVRELRSEKAHASATNRIGIPVAGGIKYTDPKNIIRLEGDGSYTHIYLLNGEKLLVSKNLKELEKLVSTENFYRSHNSHLINCNHVAEYNKTDGGYIVMCDGSTSPLSRRRKDEFLVRMSEK